MNEVLTRKPAPIVKCPHCKWVGSARGLFTHVRMAHPAINTKPPISKNKHPYELEDKPLNDLARGFLRGVNQERSTKKSAPITKREKEDFVLWATLVPALVYMFSDPDIKDILTSEGVNPKRLVVALGKI